MPRGIPNRTLATHRAEQVEMRVVETRTKEEMHAEIQELKDMLAMRNRELTEHQKDIDDLHRRCDIYERALDEILPIRQAG